MTDTPERPWRNFYGRVRGKTLRPLQKTRLEGDLPALVLHGVTREENPERRPLELSGLTGPLWLVLTGLVVLTAGFFGAHSVASGWAGARAVTARGQSTGLYNLAYYGGSSVLGWAGGLAFEAVGWGGVVAVVTAAALTTLLVQRLLVSEQSVA